MDIGIGKKTSYIRRIKNVLMVIALIGGIVLALSGLLVYYCVTSIIPLLDDIVLRTTIFSSCIIASVISSIIGSHLLIDAIIASRGIENRLKLANSEGLKVWKMIPSTLCGRIIASYVDTLLSRYYDYYLRMNLENPPHIQKKRDMGRCGIWLKIM